MRYGIFGDIHSNLEAFNKVIEAYKKEDIDRFFCVGDIVGYGADPEKCIDGLRQLGAIAVCGNHDLASAGVFSLDYFNDYARDAIVWTIDVLTDGEKQFLKNLPFVVNEKEFSIVHGSLYQPELFDYIIDIESAERCFRHMEKDICFVGHSHRAMVYCLEDSKVFRYAPGPVGLSKNRLTIRMQSGVKYIVNVGSIGQPRDGNPDAAYCVFDTTLNTIEIKRVSYDVTKSMAKILNAGLPAILGYRLLEGR